MTTTRAAASPSTMRYDIIPYLLMGAIFCSVFLFVRVGTSFCLNCSSMFEDSVSAFLVYFNLPNLFGFGWIQDAMSLERILWQVTFFVCGKGKG